MLLLCTEADSSHKPLDVGNNAYAFRLLFANRAAVKIVGNHNSVGYYHM